MPLCGSIPRLLALAFINHISTTTTNNDCSQRDPHVQSYAQKHLFIAPSISQITTVSIVAEGYGPSITNVETYLKQPLSLNALKREIQPVGDSSTCSFGSGGLSMGFPLQELSILRSVVNPF